MLQPGVAGLGDQPREVGVRRLRLVERLAGAASRSTPSTPRRSVSASCAATWITAALARSSSASRSSRNAMAPAFIEICEIRWASTSCISRAIRARSLPRAWATRSSCSASARSARSAASRSARGGSRCTCPSRGRPPRRSCSRSRVSHAGSSPWTGWMCTMVCPAARLTAARRAICHSRRRVATDTAASMPGPAARPETADSTPVNTRSAPATGGGRRRPRGRPRERDVEEEQILVLGSAPPPSGATPRRTPRA